MKYEDFKKELICELKKRFVENDKTCKCKINKLPKVNRDEEGLHVSVGDEGAAVLSLSELYDTYGNGKMRIGRVSEEVYKLVNEQINNREENSSLQAAMNIMNDKKDAEKRIIYYAVNANCNENLLKLVPYRTILDLMVIYRLVIDSDEDGVQSMVITNEQMKQMGMTEKELYEAAAVNTPRILSQRICKMYEGVSEMGGLELLSLDEQADRAIESGDAVKITCVPRVNASYNLIDITCIKLLADKLDSDLYILPSSIQELMCVKVGGRLSLERLCAIVREANSKTWIVADESYLSDSIYIYRKKKGTLSIIANK